jgi:hypothetical protein
MFALVGDAHLLLPDAMKAYYDMLVVRQAHDILETFLPSLIRPFPVGPRGFSVVLIY